MGKGHGALQRLRVLCKFHGSFANALLGDFAKFNYGSFLQGLHGALLTMGSVLGVSYIKQKFRTLHKISRNQGKIHLTNSILPPVGSVFGIGGIRYFRKLHEIFRNVKNIPTNTDPLLSGMCVMSVV